MNGPPSPSAEVIAAQQAADRRQLDDHETRLRLVETAVVALQGLPQLVQDLETRQRSDERWRYALPLASIAALGSTVAAVITAVAAIKGG